MEAVKAVFLTILGLLIVVWLWMFRALHPFLVILGVTGFIGWIATALSDRRK